MRIRWCAATDKGTVREANEDSILFNGEIVTMQDHYLSAVKERSITDEVNAFAVADGMGGHEAGEIASRMVLEHIRSSIAEKGAMFLASPDLLKTAITALHAEVNRYAVTINKRGMGTTLTGMIFNDSKLLLFNAGDSRVYIFREGYLEQRTRDHSLFQQSGGQAPKNLITSSVGGGSETITVDLYDLTGKARENDIFILCSDGLTDIDMNTHYSAIETLIKANEDDLGRLNEALLAFSMEHGSSDNISSIAVRFVNGE